MNAQPAARLRPVTTQVHVRLPNDLIDAIDRAATREYMTRTAWLVRAALHHLPPDILSELETSATP